MQKLPANIPTILVIFGATGDLMKEKIVPSLYHLFARKQLPGLFRVLGFSRADLNDETFRDHVFSILKQKKILAQKKKAEAFLELFHFQQGQFTTYGDYLTLGKHVGQIDGEWKACANKLYYIAAPPKLVRPIVQNLKRSKLSLPCGGDEGWARLLIEKPFGSDGKTAQELETVLAESFKEEQIYRIDHYLGKEMVQGILNFRFSNNLLEHSWNRNHIERIDMRLLESIGVEDRGAFYDPVGALRDVGQNHLLEMVAMLTMENPATLDAEKIRENRAKALHALKKPTLAEAAACSFRAQHEGYGRIAGVKKNSKTETYFKFVTRIENDQWKGVPIAIESGKRLGNIQKEVVVTFKHPDLCICPPDRHVKNQVIFSIQPNEGITIRFIAKKPGFAPAMELRDFHFMLYEPKGRRQFVEEYAKLLMDAIGGIQTWFVGYEEVKAAWRAVDPILAAWQKNLVPLESYKKGTIEVTKRAQEKLTREEKLIKKQVGVIGLGKMGIAIARRLMDFGWTVHGYDISATITKKMTSENVIGAYSIPQLAEQLPRPRILWLMVPSGKPVDDILFDTKNGLASILSKGDVVIDGGNSFYKDSIRRAKKLKKRGILFLDCGVSGGPAGTRNGASLMVGGDKKTFDRVEPLFRDLAQEQGYQFFAGVGAGHFVKMIHNGIEYGMMQAIAEGFDILKKSAYKLDLSRVADVYNHGSVIESRLVGWLKDAFELHGENLTSISGSSAQTGEGAWTANTAKELDVRAKVIGEAVRFRRYSQEHPSYAGKIVSALRGQFGGHSVTKK